MPSEGETIEVRRRRAAHHATAIAAEIASADVVVIMTDVVALSGGYTRADDGRRLAANLGMIASFSRALVEELKRDMSDAEFNAALAAAVDEIYRASTAQG